MSDGNFRWYVCRVKRDQERPAKSRLERQGFVAYVPQLTVNRYKLRGKKFFEVNESEPVFPSYVMVRFDVADEGWKAINSTRGVVRLIGNGETGDPVPVPKGEIEELQARENAGLLKVSEIKRIRPGDLVKIGVGYLAGRIGTCAWTKGERVTFLMNCLGAQRMVSAPSHTLSLVP